MSENFFRKSTTALTKETLPTAVGHLFQINNYDVVYGRHIHGAEVDIIATHRSDPFQARVYIEATVEYVNNTKYGKDMTKFSLIREKDPAAVCLCVSLIGFTSEVMERGLATRIRLETYEALFRRFEKFSAYIDHIDQNELIAAVINSYEPPSLRDVSGEHGAISWFNEWKHKPADAKWIVLLGEYGTGKTALTLYLQHEWLKQYASDPSQPIPVRIELRDFTRQFDARSLLHHFLDTNRLSHVPIEFMQHLIKIGRVVLILDGYDEMAQFLNTRERRACLTALASLANDGAYGLLTSRPNYFTESEELSVFDALYASIEKNKYFIGVTDKALIDSEKKIDILLQKYVLERKERYLRDLDTQQTMSLVRRKIHDDIAGQELVINILSNVFREEFDGTKKSLSGKPVIVTYLLELIDDLKGSTGGFVLEMLSEWEIYKMIVDRLMLRDFRRSPEIMPDQRRTSLHKIAIFLSDRKNSGATEEYFFKLIDDVFKNVLRRLQGEERRAKRDELFQDLRSSATLTRKENLGQAMRDSWNFSHNSLREYLVSEHIVNTILGDGIIRGEPVLSDAMRSFATSLSREKQDDLVRKLHDHWPHRGSVDMGIFISFMWDAMKVHPSGTVELMRQINGSIASEIFDISEISLERIKINGFELRNKKIRIVADHSYISDASISDIDISSSSFVDGVLESVSFRNVNLSRSYFCGCLLFECVFANVDLTGADFTGLDKASNLLFWNDSGSYEAFAENAAIGFLKYHGAITDEVPPFFIAQHHPRFSIVMKICENISEQRKSQLRGLTQRGAAHADPAFARRFVTFMNNRGLIDIDRHDLVSATSAGRRAVTQFINNNELFDGLYQFFDLD